MAQTLSSVYVHIVFSTLDRIPFLEEAELRYEMHRYLAGIAASQNCEPQEIGGVADHIHALIRLGRDSTQSHIVREMKRSSSLWIKREAPLLHGFAWQAGYGAFSVSNENRHKVIHYIQEQEIHHHKETFQEEFLRLMREHDLECEEKWLW